MTISIPLHLDNTTEQILSYEAKQRGISIEALVLQFIQQGIGLKKQTNIFTEPRPIIPVDAASARQRVLGLHQDLGWLSEDFDSPLDDEFWLPE